MPPHLVLMSTTASGLPTHLSNTALPLQLILRRTFESFTNPSSMAFASLVDALVDPDLDGDRARVLAALTAWANNNDFILHCSFFQDETKPMLLGRTIIFVGNSIPVGVIMLNDSFRSFFSSEETREIFRAGDPSQSWPVPVPARNPAGDQILSPYQRVIAALLVAGKTFTIELIHVLQQVINGKIDTPLDRPGREQDQALLADCSSHISGPSTDRWEHQVMSGEMAGVFTAGHAGDWAHPCGLALLDIEGRHPHHIPPNFYLSLVASFPDCSPVLGRAIMGSTVPLPDPDTITIYRGETSEVIFDSSQGVEDKAEEATKTEIGDAGKRLKEEVKQKAEESKGVELGERICERG
ncbi:hypothetical protein RQP46_008563 [Phenoliferia psychrophenolica]